jgi:NosR/NirI family transcriptional regulator, nitrous oxide reductase regulator
MIRIFFLAAAFMCAVLGAPAVAQPNETPATEVTAPTDTDNASAVEAEPADTADGPSLAELEALMVEDSAPAPTLKTKDIIDIAALAAFLSLALVSFWRKSTPLKYITMIAAVGYMGFAKGNLVSLVHIFGLLDLSLPILKYNVAWYMLMGFTLVSTVLWGRLYCGRVCAFGAFTQLMDKILPSSWRYEPPKWFDSKAVYVKYVILASVVIYYLITQDKFIYKYVEPFWMFTLTGDVLLWSMVGGLLLASVFIRNFYCRYLCSVGAALGLISSVSIFRIKRWQLCTSCKLCQKKCEWGAIKGPKISTGECVRCDDCEILYADKSKCPHWLLLAKNRLQRALSGARA